MQGRGDPPSPSPSPSVSAVSGRRAEPSTAERADNTVIPVPSHSPSSPPSQLHFVPTLDQPTGVSNFELIDEDPSWEQGVVDKNDEKEKLFDDWGRG